MTNNNQLTIESHFEADDVSLSRVFKRSQDTFFKVPRFQRQYTWSNDNNRSRFIIEKFVYPHWVENFYKNL